MVRGKNSKASKASAHQNITKFSAGYSHQLPAQKALTAEVLLTSTSQKIPPKKTPWSNTGSAAGTPSAIHF
jgi:hypothetical protein